MEHISSFFEKVTHNAAKKIIPELKDRDDFEVKHHSFECPKCGEEKAFGFIYRIHGEEDWREHYNGSICCDCETQEMVNVAVRYKKERVKEFLWENYNSIPDDIQHAGFKNYQKTNAVTAQAYSTAVKYFKHFRESKPENRINLLFLGNPGTGKSHLSVAIMRGLRKEGFKVGFITTVDLFSMIKETYQRGASRSEQDILKDINAFDCLVLDDIGAEANSKDELSWSKKTLYSCINARMGKPTIYTTNFDESNLEDAVGAKVASRLYNNTKFVDLFTDDYRKTLQVSSF